MNTKELISKVNTFTNRNQFTLEEEEYLYNKSKTSIYWSRLYDKLTDCCEVCGSIDCNYSNHFMNCPAGS